MYKVELRDGRVKEFSDEGNAERYAEVSNGKLLKSKVKKEVKQPIKEESE